MEEKPRVKKQYYNRIMDLYRYNPVYVPFLNPLIRSIQARKAATHIRQISEQAEGLEKEIRDWYEGHDFFFGFGMYRSGTTFLANFLNSNIPDAIVLHEANVNDYWHYAKAIHSAETAVGYIKDYRLNEIYFRVRPYSFRTYGEINPFLRRHCPAIRQLLPEAKMFQIVRHPAKVIRSLMSREQLGFKDPMKKVIYPAADDPYAGEWKHWDRFRKFCWMWTCDNKMLRESTGHSVRFEDLRSSFDLFKDRVLDHIGLEMDADTWNSGISVINNSTPRYAFPEYSDWTPDQKQFFEDMCGREMAFYNY